MAPKVLVPRKALNKAFLKVKPNRVEIEGFKTNLIQLIDKIKIIEESPKDETEEHLKNNIRDFLRDTYYRETNEINTKDKKDLVIHLSKNTNSNVGVIIEAKRPSNTAEMISTDRLNAKALQELLLYYLHERISQKNLEIKHLAITNINEWYLFDGILFERLFAQNKSLVKQFIDFENGRLADTKRDFFYKEIAAPCIEKAVSEIEFTYFNIRDYEKALRNTDKEDDNTLIALFKLLSPEHLLKLPFANDSNSLDKRFYSELLHIIGLNETREGNKKLIGRNKAEERHTGSILENAIIQLDSLDKLHRLESPNQFGNDKEERLFNVALELSITWINRILFLKLLEAQLITYHKGDKSYSFLNLDKIKSYDDLNSLFFQVLARKYEERNEDVKKAFEKVPYLNSSLFEPTDIEQITLLISNLKDNKNIPLFSQTVLKDQKGKKRSGNISTLEYLFEFLSAYDFSSEGSEDIQEDNKTLINASVLGLIFEKINGYKDGSYFTPGFITMYMCRETIRKAVIQKFNEAKKWNCSSINEVCENIDFTSFEGRKEANQIVNSIKICDPAVGSGHFLVSALNEMIAVKNDLKILQDRGGKRLKEYQVEVVNDELIVTDEEGELFEYNPASKESQRIQETFFHEKQILIENSLFGVDINSNSVKICRLRLWIELLKNAYYKNATELETLPNIDINIKCGNSLVSRFVIDADLKLALKKTKWTIESYQIAVDTYRNAENKEQKREMEKLIETIKADFKSEILVNDPKRKRLRKIKDEFINLTNQTALFEMSKKEKFSIDKKVQQLQEEIEKLDIEIEEIKANKIFETAFEWRFEFPEVLNNNGDFVGFDVVIGNPPYGVKLSEKEVLFYRNRYNSIIGHAEIYYVFIELALQHLLKANGILAYIIPNAWLSNKYARGVRELILKNFKPIEIINFNQKVVFEDAQVETCILSVEKTRHLSLVTVGQDVDFKYTFNPETWLDDDNFIINFSKSLDIQSVLKKINSSPEKFNDILDISNGCKPYQAGYGKNFYGQPLTKQDVENRIYHSKAKESDTFYPELKGKNIKPYTISKPEDYINWGDWLMSPKDSHYHFQPKILIRQIIGKKFICALDKSNAIADQSLYIAVPYVGSEISLEFVLGVLNSKLYGYYFRKFYSEEDDLFPKIKVNELKRLPFKLPESNTQKKIIGLVTQIIKEKEFNPAFNSFDIENEIDQLVYQLYGLTEEEIKIIEGDS